MLKYILKRLILIPLTLFAIISINFIILNAAPGDVIEEQSVDAFGDPGKSDKIRTYKGPDRYLQFREHYGLTLPIFFNTRPAISHAKVKSGIEEIVDCFIKKQSFSKLKIYWGDRAKFLLPVLLFEANDNTKTPSYRHVAADLFIRGAIRQGIVGSGLSPEQYAYNERVSKSNAMLVKLLSEEDIGIKVDSLKEWFRQEGGMEAFPYRHFSWKTFF